MLLTVCIPHEEYTNDRYAYSTSALYAAAVSWFGIFIAKHRYQDHP